MKASELHRKLFFKGHSELSTFLEDSPINYHLYQFMHDVKSRYQVNGSMADILNEVYFVCIRANRDFTPGNNISERYIAEEKAWTGSSLTTELIFSLVYLVCKLQNQLSYRMECFVKSITDFTTNCIFHHELKMFIEKMKTQGNVHYETDFTPQPVPVNELPEYQENSTPTIIDRIMWEQSQSVNPWRVVTNEYSQTTILDFLRCYHTKEEQRTLLGLIKKSSRTGERIQMESFYIETSQLINIGEFLPRMSEKPSNTVTVDDGKRELSIAYQQIEFLKQQLSDLKTSHATEISTLRAESDRRLARMDAQYNAALAANKQEEESKTIIKDKASEPFFTIAELANHAKSQCSRQGAEAVATMLYRLSGIHGFTDDTTFSLIDSIIPAIDQREAKHQTIEMPNVSQFNSNPQTVNNYGDQN